MRSVVGRQAVFTLGMLTLGCVEMAIGPIFGRHGIEAIWYSVILCLVPGWLTIFAGELLRFRNISAYIVLVGTGLRVLFVLIGWCAISAVRRDLGFEEFAIWLIAGYLVALALETWMVLIPSGSQSPG